jgi:hypothetical protein
MLFRAMSRRHEMCYCVLTLLCFLFSQEAVISLLSFFIFRDPAILRHQHPNQDVFVPNFLN